MWLCTEIWNVFSYMYTECNLYDAQMYAQMSERAPSGKTALTQRKYSF
jgi:hypothetical protein